MMTRSTFQAKRFKPLCRFKQQPQIHLVRTLVINIRRNGNPVPGLFPDKCVGKSPYGIWRSIVGTSFAPPTNALPLWTTNTSYTWPVAQTSGYSEMKVVVSRFLGMGKYGIPSLGLLSSSNRLCWFHWAGIWTPPAASLFVSVWVEPVPLALTTNWVGVVSAGLVMLFLCPNGGEDWISTIIPVAVHSYNWLLVAILSSSPYFLFSMIRNKAWYLP